MGPERVGGWSRRRFRAALLHLPPRLRGAVAQGGWRLFYRRLARRARDRDAEWAARMTAPPLPPAELRSLVGWPLDAEHFLASGDENFRLIRGVLAEAGISPRGRVLDFGCGCGRLARWWARYRDPIQLHGCDPHPELVAWCQENLAGMTASRSEDLPPTAYPDTHFDLIYAFSVFTHLTTCAQDAWLDELHRILKPGGALFFTVNGGIAASSLPHREMTAFVRGEPVTLFEEATGSNICAAYRPAGYVEEHMTRRFERLVALPASSPRSAIEQDAYLVRKPARDRALALVAS